MNLISLRGLLRDLLSSVRKTVAGLALGVVVVTVGTGRAIFGALEGWLALTLARLRGAVSGVPVVVVTLTS